MSDNVSQASAKLSHIDCVDTKNIIRFNLENISRKSIRPETLDTHDLICSVVVIIRFGRFYCKNIAL